MANNLSVEKKTAVIAALCEGASIRAVERMTGVNRQTVMRLGVRVGEACAKLHDEQMRELNCTNVQIDEAWGFVGKKQRQVTEADEGMFVGDVWVYVALDSDTKLVAGFLSGKRDMAHTAAFVSDLASRMKNRIQLSSDGMNQYLNVVESEFGSGVDYGQIVKSFSSPEAPEARRYSPPVVTGVTRTSISGNPDESKICTSHVEKQNHTLRMHCRRMSRLTNAFSKKFEHFSAAVALHYAYYNFVKINSAVRMTPAMAAGVASRLWTVQDLVELAE
jgi:IS1 family transposase